MAVSSFVKLKIAYLLKSDICILYTSVDEGGCESVVTFCGIWRSETGEGEGKGEASGLVTQPGALQSKEGRQRVPLKKWCYQNWLKEWGKFPLSLRCQFCQFCPQLIGELCLRHLLTRIKPRQLNLLLDVKVRAYVDWKGARKSGAQRVLDPLKCGSLPLSCKCVVCPGLLDNGIVRYFSHTSKHPFKQVVWCFVCYMQAKISSLWKLANLLTVLIMGFGQEGL